MALAFSQSYTFSHADYAWGGDDAALFQNGLYDLKEMFVAAGWTVKGSHDGQGNFGNNDDVDHWSSPSQIDRNPTSNDPWVVLEAPAGFPTNFTLLIYCNFVTTNANLGRLSFVSSPSGGFFTANGGTNGSATTIPTATDQTAHFTNVYTFEDGVGYSQHFAVSADETQHFLLIQNGNVKTTFFCLSVVDNPPSGLDDGVVWCCLNGGNAGFSEDYFDPAYGNALDPVLHYSAANWRGEFSGTVRALYVADRGFNNSAFHAQQFVPSSNEVTLTPCELFGSVSANDGYNGTVPDLYWGPEFLHSKGLGDAVDGSINWYACGGLIIPWDATERLPRGF